MKAIVITGWKHELNIAAILRTANGLGFDEFIIQGKEWKRSPVMTKKSLNGWKPGIKPKLIHFDEINEVMEYIKQNNYTPISMEIDDESEDLKRFVWPENPAIIVGHENGGIPKEILKDSQKIQVPMEGEIRCMNVACAGSIAMYDYTLKQGI